MNFSDFYKPQIFHKKKIAKNIEVKGFLKKKKEKSMTRKLGLLDKSYRQYFQFFDNGRIFAYFEQEPSKSKQVFNYVYMADVNKIQDNTDGKSSHFSIETDNGSIIFKCEDEKLKKKWVSTLKFFSAMYSPLENQKCKDLVEEISTHTLAIIHREIEIQNWDAYKKFLDYSQFIRAKGLVPIFTKNDLAVLKHRVLISSNSMTIQSKEDEQQKQEERNKKQKKSIFGKNENQEEADLRKQYFVLITQKQSFKLDQKYREKNKIILNSSNLILGYNFDQIYMFNMKDSEDYTPSYKQIKMDEILGVWIEKNPQTIKIILIQDNMILRFQTSIEVTNWIEALNNCYDESFQKSRLNLKYIKYDVDFYYEVFLDLENPNRFQSLQESLNQLPNKDDNLDQQIEDLKTQQNNIKDLIECIYSNKPFYAKMFIRLMNYLNKEYLNFINTFWRINIADIESEQILELLKILNDYQELLKKWGLKFQSIHHTDAFFSCYLGKEFQEQSENIYNILFDFSNGNSNFKFVLEQFDHCITKQIESIQYFDTRRQIVQLYQNTSIIVSQFFSCIFDILTKNSQKLESIVDILNQSFEKYFDDMILRLKENSLKKLNLDEIQQIILQQNLLTVIEQIKKSCKEKIYNRVKQDVDEQIQFPDILDQIDISQNLKRPLREIIEKLLKLQNEDFQKQLIKFCLNISCNKFIKQFLNSTEQINNTNKEDVSLMLQSVQNCFTRQVKETNIEEDFVILRIKYLLQIFNTNNLDEFIMYILKLNVFSQEFTQQENIRKLLRTKIYFPQESIDYLRTFFENIQPTNNQEQPEKISSQNQVQENSKRITQSSQSFYYVILFIKKLSKLIREKSQRKKGKRSQKSKSRKRTKL